MKRSDLLGHALSFSGANALARVITRKKLVIFNYHRLRRDTREAHGYWDTLYGPTASEFRRQVEWLKRHTRVLSEAELIDWVKAGKTESRDFPSLASMITFDDGYLDNYELAYPVLRELGVPATFFIPTQAIDERELGWWDQIAWILSHAVKRKFRVQGVDYDLEVSSMRDISNELVLRYRVLPPEQGRVFMAELENGCGATAPGLAERDRQLMNWDQVREVSRNGISIGSHTVNHRLLSRITPEEQRYEVSESKAILERQVGAPVRSLAYPVGSYEDFQAVTQAIVRESGYDVAYSFMTGANYPGALDPWDIRRIHGPDSVGKLASMYSWSIFRQAHRPW